MLKVCFDIIDGCDYGRDRNMIKYFKDEKELDEYESRLANGMYFIEIHHIEKVKEGEANEK